MELAAEVSRIRVESFGTRMIGRILHQLIQDQAAIVFQIFVQKMRELLVQALGEEDIDRTSSAQQQIFCLHILNLRRGERGEISDLDQVPDHRKLPESLRDKDAAHLTALLDKGVEETAEDRCSCGRDLQRLAPIEADLSISLAPCQQRQGPIKSPIVNCLWQLNIHGDFKYSRILAFFNLFRHGIGDLTV